MKKFYSFALVLWLLVPLTNILLAQKPMGIKVTKPTVCYAHTADNPCYIAPPEEYLKWAGSTRTKTSNIEVTYNAGFTAEAIAAFDYALGIWESLIDSPVPIRIDAYWSSLSPNVLGGAIYTNAYANFPGAQKLNVFYPVALAEKITGRNLNGNNPDIFVQFNNNANWNFNPTNPSLPQGQFDLVSVVLHEIGHGLGFAGSFSISGSNGQVGLQGTGIPIIYDVPIENFAAENLIRIYSSPSVDLRSQITSENLFFNSATSSRPKLFAPSTFSGGSSISHLDEVTFNNTPSALMTPQIAPQERIHDPGIAWNMLKDMGWEMVRINHIKLSDTENIDGPYSVTASFQADNGIATNTVKLNYTLDGTTFTSITMNPTGLPNEFTASIPGTGVARQYGYYISVNDNAGREFVNPGKIVRKLQPELQNIFIFETGPDNKPPAISHSPKPFLLASETELELEARITDNIGIASAIVEYSINDVTQPNQTLILQAPQADSIYRRTLLFGSLNNGDVIKYRIVATDNSSNSNVRTAPATGFFTLNVVGLEPTQDSYTNNFNSPSNDFFGNGFSIVQPAGFNDQAIHSDHPYAEGNGQPNNELNLVYQLKIPIRVKAKEATIVFDEIVLVEPGQTGTVFGDEQFWDYVVVEGSKDGGITWTPVADGYDSRANSAWLTRYNSAITGNNSTAVGDPALFRTRTLDLQNKFDTNDEVVIRFRLFSDPFAAGWGWTIDNLKIQIDDTPPLVLHDHIDYLKDTEDELVIITKASDASGIKSLKIEYKVNNGTVSDIDFNVNPPASQYQFTLSGLAALSAGNVLEYRIVATDSVDNEGFFPPSGNFIKVPVINFGTPAATYANNFNSPSNDFVGNFFSIAQPNLFVDGAIHSEHFYPNGVGLDKTSSYSYMLTRPITISAANPLIRFDEIVVVEGHGVGVAFGSANFRDYVIVEGSKNGGNTWSRFLDGYDIVGGLSSWISAFSTGSNPNAGMFRNRTINMTANGNFQPGDQVIIRFRLFANETINGWGWAIDNLFIQDPITSVEQLNTGINIYPNPVTQQLLNIELENNTIGEIRIDLTTVQGQQLQTVSLNPSTEKTKHQLDLSGLPAGMYIITLNGRSGERVTKKIIKTQ
ncbi:MAG: T9SS type A sorting domain-containing protein [Cyclobacteriaceae bacterium]|nr:T9SS type A sorting domain-containing protein [Cyclobacteriaceae bacterium]UYN86629.1 MAG: T9SS type A sorting domain-containing protein [Cyclobacteriaceae bacterium]